MGDSGTPEARERLRRAVRDYAGKRRTMVASRASPEAAAPGAGASAVASGDTAARRRAAGPVTAPYDERGLRALAKEIKALVSEDGRRGIRVG